MRLGVNIDHIATLRSQRDTPYPDPAWAVPIVELAGADGITCHIRLDRRHITERDLKLIKELTTTHLNVELCTDQNIVKLISDLKPDHACLVPERAEEQTTEGGLDIIRARKDIEESVKVLRAADISVTLFVEPEEAIMEAAKEIGVSAVELNTDSYCKVGGDEIERLKNAAIAAHNLGLEVHGGHGLNYQNVRGILSVPHLVELNIGHSIVSRAVFTGLSQAVKEMLNAIAQCKRRRGEREKGRKGEG